MENLPDLFSFGRKLNTKSIKKEFWIWVLLGIGLYIASKPLDRVIFPWLKDHVHTIELDALSIFLTEQFIYALMIIFVGLTAWRVWKNPRHNSKLLPGAFAVFVAGVTGTIAKEFFGIPRPFLQFENLDPLVYASFSSFPSNHTAISFALLIPIYRISRLAGIAWGGLALAVGMARIYQNVHFPSDIAGGIFLGGIIGAIFSNPNAELLLKKWWKKLEFRRQTFHFLAGFMCVFAHWVGVLRWRFVLFLLIFGLILSAISAKKNIPFVSNLLRMFDRQRDHDFPGRGAFYFLLGIFLCIVIFPVKIAYAAILILSIGDSINHLFFDRKPKNLNLPWNRKKSLMGLALGIVSGTFAAQFFVPFFPALIATSVALLLETWPLKIGRWFIDDNISVPLVSGAILALLI